MWVLVKKYAKLFPTQDETNKIYYHIGYFSPNCSSISDGFHAIFTRKNVKTAAKLVHYLNGGDGEIPDLQEDEYDPK